MEEYSKPGLVASLSLLCFRWINRMDWLAKSLHSGFFLALLSTKDLHSLDHAYHGDSAKYLSEEYNLSGLYPWEKQAVEEFFPPAGSLGVLGAGAGREIIELHRLGYTIRAWECNAELRRRAREIFDTHSLDLDILPMQPDLCPDFEENVDAVILAWGVYSLIRGRAIRVRLLEKLRAYSRPNAPLLLSFFLVSEPAWARRLTGRIARVLRPILRGPLFEDGDRLSPRFVHLFSRESLCSELEEAGWSVADFRLAPYPHAIARKKTDTSLRRKV